MDEIQLILHEPSFLLPAIVISVFFYYFGRMLAWCFKGGFFRILLGAYLSYGVLTFLMASMPLMIKIAFFSGFILYFFDGWQGIIRRKDNLLWRIERFWNSGFVRFLRGLFAEKPEQKQSADNKQSEHQNTENRQSEYQKTGQRQQEDIDRERARRAEEMHRQREAEKARKQAEKDQQEKAEKRKSEKSEGKKSGKSEKKKTENNQQYQKTESQKSDDFDGDWNAHIQKIIRGGYLEKLGLDPDGEYTQAEIKKAYRRQANKYHPDRHMGKSEAEIKAMNEKFAEIKRAYEWLREN